MATKSYFSRWPTVARPVAAALMLFPMLRAYAQQLPPIFAPVPKIQFDAWKEAASEENVLAYSETFPSAVHSIYPENNIVPLRITIPADADRAVPAVIILHYWGATDLQVEDELAREINDRGMAAIIVTLPYHLARTPKGSRSGKMAIVPDSGKMIETMTQSVYDVRRTIDFLETRPEIDHSKIGVAGISLGSIVATLAYGIDDRLKFGAFMLGGADLAHIIWHSSRVVEVREELRHRGYTESKLREELDSIDARRFLSSRPGDHTLVIGGKYDTVVPKSDTQKLIDALPGCQVLWLDTGHYGGVFVEKRILRTAADFFSKCFAGQSYLAPSHLYAPTLRIGAIADTLSGLQIAAGIDLFKPGPKSIFMSTILVTPRGLKLFAGFPLGAGLAVGGFASPKGLSVGGWWSIVL